MVFNLCEHRWNIQFCVLRRGPVSGRASRLFGDGREEEDFQEVPGGTEGPVFLECVAVDTTPRRSRAEPTVGPPRGVPRLPSRLPVIDAPRPRSSQLPSGAPLASSGSCQKKNKNGVLRM